MASLAAVIVVLLWAALIGGVVLLVRGPTKRARWIGAGLLLALVVFAAVSAAGWAHVTEIQVSPPQ